MKVVFSIIVAFSFLFYSVGFQLFSQLRESANRAQIRETIQQKPIEQLRLSLHDYSHLVDNKSEFTFNGNRYDIVAVVPFGDSVLVDCYHDHVEEEITAFYNAFIHHFIKGHTGTGKKGGYAKLMVVDYIPVSKQSSTYLVIDCPMENNYSFTDSYSSIAYAVLVPPPQFFV